MNILSYRKLVLGILISGAFALSSHAAMMTLELYANIRGASSSAGSLTATFTDAPPGQNGVFLDLDTSNLAAGKKVQSWYFNLDPAINPGSLAFSQTNKIGSFTNPTISKSGNEIPPGGGPSFDISFTFSTAGPPNSFGGGESVRPVFHLRHFRIECRQFQLSLSLQRRGLLVGRTRAGKPKRTRGSDHRIRSRTGPRDIRGTSARWVGLDRAWTHPRLDAHEIEVSSASRSNAASRRRTPDPGDGA